MSISETAFSTFEEIVSGLDPEIERITRSLRRLILEIHPEAIEVVRLGDGAASFGVGPKKMSEAHTYIMPRAGYVNLGFYHGVSLTDPEGLLEGTGKRLRHVKVYSLNDIERPELRRLLEAALANRKKAQ